MRSMCWVLGNIADVRTDSGEMSFYDFSVNLGDYIDLAHNVLVDVDEKVMAAIEHVQGHGMKVEEKEVQGS